MSVITDAEALAMIQRLDAKAPALLKPLAASLGLDSEEVCGEVVRDVWDRFRNGEYGRDYYPYSHELEVMTQRVNRCHCVTLEPWHVWGILCRAHKLPKNWHTRYGKRASYLRDIKDRYGITQKQVLVMGSVPLKMAGKLGDDVAMTHVITKAANTLAIFCGWGDWFDDRFVFNAMVLCRKAGSRRKA